MIKNDLVAIGKYINEEKLTQRDKELRKNISNEIESRLEYIVTSNNLLKNYKISRSYTKTFNLFLKKQDQQIYITIQYDPQVNKITFFVKGSLVYYFDSKYPIRLNKKCIKEINPLVKIQNKDNLHEIVYFKKEINLDIDIEEEIVNNLKIIESESADYEIIFEEILNNIKETDVFYFDEEFNILVDEEDFVNLLNPSPALEVDHLKLNEELFEKYNNSSVRDENRIKLLIAHLNIQLAKRFIFVEYDFFDSKEKIYLQKQIVKNLLRAIEKHEPEKATFATYSYMWFSQAQNRAHTKIIQKRMINKFGVTPGITKLEQYKVKYRKETGDYIPFQDYIKYAEKISRQISKENSEREVRKYKSDISASSIFKLVKLIFDTETYKKEDLIEFRDYFLVLSEACLNTRPKEIFILRYLNSENNILEKTTTLQEIGDSYSLTRERIRQIDTITTKYIKVAATKFPPKKKINKNWLELINKNENKRGIGKIGKILADEEIFYMGQLKKLGPEKLYEIVKHKGVDMERVQNFYFRKVPPNKFQKNKKDLPIGALRLSTRSWNALNSTGIEKISEIDIQNLDKISNLGVLSIKEITLKYLEFTQD